MKEFTVVDVGDSSVGMPEVETASLKVSDDMYDLMVEQNTKADFMKKFEALIKEFFEPEVRYETIDQEAEKLFWEEFQK